MTARLSWFAVLVAVSASVGSAEAQTVAAGVVAAAGSPAVIVEEGCFAHGELPPFVTIEGGFSFLRRSTPNRNGLIGELVNLDTGEVLTGFDVGRLDYPVETGAQVMLRFHRQGGGSFDLRWLGVSGWNVNDAIETDQVDPIGTRTPISPFSFVLEEGSEAGGIRARVLSSFHSFQAGCTGVLADNDCYTLSDYYGFRYLYFRDSIEVERAGTVDREVYGFGANNSLLGFETGLDLANHFGFLTLGARGRVGGYANFADLKGTYDVAIGSQPGFFPAIITTPTDRFSGFSGVLDLGVYGTIHASRTFALKVGYDFILLTNLVLAAENMQPSIITVTPGAGLFPVIGHGDVHARGGSAVVLHGLSLTGEVTW